MCYVHDCAWECESVFAFNMVCFHVSLAYVSRESQGCMLVLVPVSVVAPPHTHSHEEAHGILTYTGAAS